MKRFIAALMLLSLFGLPATLRGDEYDGHPYRYSRPLTYYDRQPFRPHLNYDGYPPRRNLVGSRVALVPRRDDHFDYFDLTPTRLEQRPEHRIRPPYYPSAYLLYRDQPHYGAFNHSGFP
jgi:hypothetical protein